MWNAEQVRSACCQGVKIRKGPTHLSFQVHVALHYCAQGLPCLRPGYFHGHHHVDLQAMVQPDLQRLSKDQELCDGPFRRRQVVVRRVHHIWLPPGMLQSCFAHDRSFANNSPSSWRMKPINPRRLSRVGTFRTLSPTLWPITITR